MPILPSCLHGTGVREQYLFIQQFGGGCREDEARHWLRSELWVSFSAVTLLVGSQENKQDSSNLYEPVLLILKRSCFHNVEEETKIYLENAH